MPYFRRAPRPRRSARTLRGAALVSLGLLALPAGAVSAIEMADMSIEDLANIEITSVSKKPERLAAAAASVFVISADDIRHSGAATLPEVLRLAPNLNVAAVSGSGVAISARGMNGSNNSAPNKLLVLIDGRSVYAPLFSGVFWDAQDVLLEDIERIEVISGPGGTLWGVNAVNGVINIITRAASDTQGGLLALGAGQRGGDAGFRQGGAMADGHWRVSGKLLERSALALGNGNPVSDGWRRAQLGMRADWGSGAERFSVNGALYRAALGQPAPGAISVPGTTVQLGTIRNEGANLTGSWTHALDGGASLSVQAYVDHSWRQVPPAFTESLDIVDLQIQHALGQRGAHQLVWGANLRQGWDRVTSSELVAFLPARLNQHWSSLFVQDEVALREDLRLTAGVRFERNDYTGLEVLPTLRLGWQLAPAHAVWAGLSRTVRAPSRLDVDAYIPGRPPYLLDGGRQVRSEVATVTELGYRGQPSSALSVSATLFHNEYRRLRTQEIDPSYTFLTFDSKMRGQSTGIEAWGNWQASKNWRLSAGWTALRERFTLEPGSNDEAGPGAAGKDPAYTLQLRSSLSFGGDKEFDVALRKVAALQNPAVPAYSALDARLGWNVKPGLVLSLVGQNLNGGHTEYGAAETSSEMPRAVAVRLVWQL
ncbi:MAG: TonB-dependent receptor [Massilia sp.]